MANFCTICGTPIDPATGLCPKCTSEHAHAAKHDIEKIKAEKSVETAKEKAKRKEEKKLAWNLAKKRYAEDVAAKKAILKQAKKDKKKAKLAAMSTKKKVARVLLKFLLVVLILALLVIGGYFGAKKLFPAPDEDTSRESMSTTAPTTGTEKPDEEYVGSIGTHNPPDHQLPDEYIPASPNADAYFQQNSEIVSEIPADTAGRTEAEAYQNLAERGFSSHPITAEYTMDGTYCGEQEISSTGTTKHPVYTTFFVANSGEIWLILEINGTIFANPVSYNYDHGDNIPKLLAETETVTSYDSTLNKFYVTKPAETTLDVRAVERIDAETLSVLDIRTVEKFNTETEDALITQEEALYE